MKTWLLLFVSAGMMMGIYSCQCESCNRENYRYNIELNGFSDTEITPVVLKRYVKTSAFTLFKDSSILTDFTPYQNLTNEATGYSISLYDDNATDYIIRIPKVNGEYRITNMSFELGECRTCAKTYHINFFKVYAINGISTLPAGNDWGGSIVIQK